MLSVNETKKKGSNFSHTIHNSKSFLDKDDISKIELERKTHLKSMRAQRSLTNSEKAELSRLCEKYGDALEN